MKVKKSFALPDLSVTALNFFGRLADRIHLFKDEDLRKPLMRMTAIKYQSKMLFVTIIGTLLTLAVTLPFLFRWFVPFFAVTASLGLTLLVAISIFLIMYLYPSYSASNRKRGIDRSINFTTQYMAILAGADVTPEKIFKSVLKSDVEKVVKDEVGEIVKRIDVFGEDFYTAIGSRISETPSRNFSDLLKGILAVGNMGGDMRRYLHLQGKIFMREKKISMKRQLDGLGVAAEIYISMVVVLPLIMVVMLTTMSFIGGGGINTLLWLYVVTFVLVPVCSIVMLLILDTSVPREE